MKFNVWQWFWERVWALSEWSGVGLGRLAPWVFHQMIGCNIEVKNVNND